jgi:hypothetical protein
MGWSESLEVAKMARGICVFQSETRAPELHVQGVLLCIEGVNLSLDALDEGISVVVALEVSVESPIFQPERFLDHQGIGVGVGLNLSKEPGWHGVRDVMGVDAGDGVEVLDENVVVLSSGRTHDSSLVNILDVAGLYDISIDGDGEMGNTSVVLFETLQTLGFGGSLIVSDVTLKVTNGSSGSGLKGRGAEIPKSFSLSNGGIESFLPDDIGFSASRVNSLLRSVGLSSEAFNEFGLVSDSSGFGVQLGNSGTGDGFSQGVSSLGCESTSGVIEDVKSSFWFNKGLANHLEDCG